MIDQPACGARNNLKTILRTYPKWIKKSDHSKTINQQIHGQIVHNEKYNPQQQPEKGWKWQILSWEGGGGNNEYHELIKISFIF